MVDSISVIMPVFNERHLVAHSIDRVLAIRDGLDASLQLIVVDDASTDGTREILRRLSGELGFEYIEHETNQGKGAAVRTALDRASGAVTLIQDADLEYDPQDIPRLLVPFEKGADAVFGSRFLTYGYRRVLFFRHAMVNKILTFLTSLITDLNLTDMETCYKAVRTDLMKSIPIRSNDFRFEPELTIKLAKRSARIFEVPISYSGRTYREGKKIGVRDGFLAFSALFHWWLIDDIYQEDQYGSNILVDLSSVPHFNRWMGDTLAPDIGSRVLEVGAGIGNLSMQFIPRDHYTASDINPHYLHFLKNFSQGKPYMDIRKVDLADPLDFEEVKDEYDTVICVNVLEHIQDEGQALRNIGRALEPGGRAIILVPQGPSLYGTLDEVLGHVKRYTRESLREAVEKQGFQVERMYDFNRVTTPAWWFNGRVIKRRHFSKIQLKIVNLMTWLFRILERILPWRGASVVVVARWPESKELA